MKHSNDNHVTLYNGLSDVLIADAQLTAMGRSNTLLPLCETILKYGLEDKVGLRLLHNHNQIAPGEIMLEQEEVDQKGNYCLSTVATPETDCADKAFANSWSLEEGCRAPLEYSLDPHVAADSDALINQNEFLRELRLQLQTLNATGILGPCVLRRRFYEERMPADAPDALLVETTDEKRRANILKFYTHHNFNLDQLIETVWVASKEEAVENLATCTSSSSCSSRCYPTAVIHCERNADGSHTSTTTNSHSNSHDKVTTHDFTPD